MAKRLMDATVIAPSFEERLHKKQFQIALKKKIMGGKYEFIQRDQGAYDCLTFTFLGTDNNQIETDSDEPFQKSEREPSSTPLKSLEDEAAAASTQTTYKKFHE